MLAQVLQREVRRMRKIVLAAAITGAALTLSGCSGSNEDAADATAEGAAAKPQADAAVAGGTVDATTAEGGATLNANTATAEQLAGAGLSREVASVIVAGRPYPTVVGLNNKLRETLSEAAAGAVLVNVFVPVNLNSASREEIQLIPGMTGRMVGEFLEYRPYEDMNEFNREIGKYVDGAEVARFRRYVTL
jgi:DNA uptake protein ComE-like DNA-binding protein